MTKTTTNLTLSSLLSVVLALGACVDGSGPDADPGNVVNVYNWADYIAPDTIEKFEAEYRRDLGEPLGTIKARVRRGMSRLKEQLALVL